jgi:hypothetical protein
MSSGLCAHLLSFRLLLEHWMPNDLRDATSPLFTSVYVQTPLVVARRDSSGGSLSSPRCLYGDAESLVFLLAVSRSFVFNPYLTPNYKVGCIPAVFRWKTYRRCCSRVRAELELRLRSGSSGLLALTITRHTRHIEFIMNE